MRQILVFDAFGKKYRTKQFSATKAMEYLNRATDMSPLEILCDTELLDGDNWLKLNDRDVINKKVGDITGMMMPKLALNGVCALVSDHSFGFLKNWKSAKVPARFVSGVDAVRSEALDPMLSHLIQEGAATLKELEEYYSLEDAFKMFDVLVVQGINKALAYEAAEKEAKTKKR
jgi:hypothetical protein